MTITARPAGAWLQRLAGDDYSLATAYRTTRPTTNASHHTVSHHNEH